MACYGVLMEFRMKRGMGKEDSGAGGLLKGLVRGDRASGSVVSLKPVPVDEIFEIEARTVGIGAAEADGLRRRYGEFIGRFVDGIMAEYGNAGTVELSSGREASLLAGIMNAFHGLGTSYGERSRMIEAMGDGRFNCYSSSILVSDAMVRLGVPVDIATMPNHVLPVALRHMIETTLEPRDAVLPISMLDTRYSLVRRVGVDGLLGIAWNNYGTALVEKGMVVPALKAYDRALAMIPGHVGFLFNKGILLFDAGFTEDARRVYKELLRGDSPTVPPHAWQRISMAMLMIGDIKGALNACAMAAEEEPGDRVAAGIRELLLAMVEENEQ